MLLLGTENVKSMDYFSYLSADPFHTLHSESLKLDPRVLTLHPVSIPQPVWGFELEMTLSS